MNLPIWQVVVAVLLSWIGLAGLTDGVVQWKEWFELGWMVHWRAIKAVLIEYAFFWLPFEVPTYLIDYLTIGAVTARATVVGFLLYQANLKKIRLRNSLRSKEKRGEPVSVQLEMYKERDFYREAILAIKGGLFLLFLFTVLAWPYIIAIAVVTNSRRVAHTISFSRLGWIQRSNLLVDGSSLGGFLTLAYCARIAGKTILLIFVTSVSTFLAFLFVASDISYKLGIT
ncbi:MAG: hypothetical protein ABJX35_01605 [Hyphomicrobiales bacterium]